MDEPIQQVLNMIHSDQRFQEYCNTNLYKGFYKLREQNYKLWGQTTMTFTNGEKEIFATGPFREVTLANIFDKIDTYMHLKPAGNAP